jgi:FkbM family methyltransferase
MIFFENKVEGGRRIIRIFGIKFSTRIKQSESEKIFKYCKDKPRFQQECIKLQGLNLTVPDLPSFACQVKEIFCNEIYKFNSEKETPLIYDCGANIGISILYFKKLFPNSIIKAFEADGKIFNILSKNVKSLNGVELFHNAVWVNNDELYFNSEGADGGSLINDFENKQKVKAIRLKELLQKEQSVDFLKMDIEGAETAVIADCSEELKKVVNLFIEYHSMVGEPQTLDKILSIMTNAGFKYHLQNISRQEYPFIKTSIWTNMDLQVNVFGYRN